MSRVATLVVLAFSALSGSVSAAALVPRANNGDTSDCVTRYAGTLAALSNGTFKTFTYSTKNQVAYTGMGDSPLVVQFQECNSLKSGSASSVVLAGRLYAPHFKQCIAITNQGTAAAPYYTTMSGCSTAYAQRFQLNETQGGGAVTWVGNTSPSTGARQGGCGSLGYKANTAGQPIITHTLQQITLECNTTAPFYLATGVH